MPDLTTPWTRLAGAVVVGAAACASPPTAAHLRDLDAALAAPSPATGARLADNLAAILADLRSRGVRPAPGLRASYALQLARTGRATEAMAALAEERAAYPQAGRFLDALGERLARGGGER